MVKLLSRAAIAAAAACFAPAAGAAAPSIEAFAAGMDYGSPALSPDGTKLVYLGRAQGKRVVFMLDLAKKQRTMIVEARFDDYLVKRCDFKNDDLLLCKLSGTDFFHGQAFAVSRLIAVDVTGKEKPRVLIQKTDRALSQFQDRIIDWQIHDPAKVLIALNELDGSAFPDVFALDVYTGLLSRRPLVPYREPISSWYADRNGVVRFGEGYDDRGAVYVTRDSTEVPWRVLAEWKPGESDFDVVGFGPGASTLLISANHNGRKAVFELDITKGERQLLFSHPDVDVVEPVEWPTDGRLVGFEFATDRYSRKLFDEEAAAVYATVDASLPDSENHIIGAARDGKRYLISSRLDTRPNHYFLLDVAQKQMQRVGSANPELDASGPLASMKAVRIKGADGALLPGYLTLPLGSSGKDLPMVVYPHGGPHARDTWGFDPVVQFIASRGYAVLQVNFRGSTGYGDDWYRAGFQNWGTVMVDDITAATKWAIAEGVADPARTCIVGWSYGGYAALMSAVREPALYRCAASIAGVSDLNTLAREDAHFQGGRTAVKVTLGNDSDELKAGSPLRAPEKIRIPVLLVHGEDDTTVVPEQSERMARMLQLAKKKHELMIIKDGDHSLSRFEWRQALYAKLEEFLKANL